MARVTGIGGIFFRCSDPDAQKAWYKEQLGFNTDEYGTTFEWLQAPDGRAKGFTQWSPFKSSTTYFDNEYMVNYRVDDLQALLKDLEAAGVTICDEVQEESYGKFVHILDPEGNKIELWEPNDEVYDEMVEKRTS